MLRPDKPKLSLLSHSNLKEFIVLRVHSDIPVENFFADTIDILNFKRD